jgi:hypothetical protein
MVILFWIWNQDTDVWQTYEEKFGVGTTGSTFLKKNANNRNDQEESGVFVDVSRIGTQIHQ